MEQGPINNKTYKSFIEDAKLHATKAAFKAMIKGVYGFESKRCNSPPRQFLKLSEFLKSAKRPNVFCGKLKTIKTGKEFFFGVTEVGKFWEGEQGTSMLVKMWKSDKPQFLNTKTYDENCEIYMWGELETESINDVDVDEFLKGMELDVNAELKM